MDFKTIKSICLACLALLILFYPSKIDALSHKWIAIPKNQYGEQVWDQNSIKKNPDGFIRVLSKVVPQNTTDITQNILYTMEINCSDQVFKDIAVGSNEFNEFKNNDSEWKDPNGDKLILGVIDQVCFFIN